MDDLEICKRIAEIEGFNTWVSDEGCTYEELHIDHGGTYNPLTDDGLCFRLMFKYNITCFSAAMFKEDIPTAIYVAQSPDVDDVIDESPNKAILLAIIESSEE